ncbi:MAG: hypothetical protein JRH05_04885 [Deltaproteobacteria bacterium]|nr:hypothetical protein [Deltaproteobacteria bacterium]
MDDHDGQTAGPMDLTEEDMARIRDAFSERIEPKLKRIHARVGTLCCDFAGPRYENWMIHFSSRGDGFEIVDFEYDEDGTAIDLDL